MLVAALVTTMLGPLTHADDGHDADFQPLVVHDASQHQFTPDSASTNTPLTDQHCVACHFVRLLRDTQQVSPAVQPQLLGVSVGYDRPGRALAPAGGPPLPARAPPTSSIA